MKYSIEFAEELIKVLERLKKSNPVMFKKLGKIILDISEHPRSGIGHPEPLKGGEDMVYSRHLSAHDRVVYRIFDDTVVVLVVAIEGHYNDK